MAKQIIEINSIDDFDHNRDTIIDASAGTGKTYTITHMIIPHLLCQRDADYSLSNILIVTFTNKAAGELRDRIRRELTDLAQKLTDEKDADLKKKIDAEVEAINDASIYTIDSFCQKTLTENAVYANCAQNLKLVDENVSLDIFVGKYVRDKLAKDNDSLFMRLYADEPNLFPQTIKTAIRQYYLNNGAENPDIISLVGMTPDEEQEFAEFEQTGKIPDGRAVDFQRYFVIKHLAEIYTGWQRDKRAKNHQTFTDMKTTVHDALSAPGSKLLQVLKAKYKYALIDEFQDTDPLQWNIFKAIFATDNDHHMTIVGDPKQAIFAFRGADPKVYHIAQDYIKRNRMAAIWNLNTNYRSSAPMIEAINHLCNNDLNVIVNTTVNNYQNSLFPDGPKAIRPALLDGRDVPPVHTMAASNTEDTIVATIIEYCTRDKNNKTRLQIWDKDTHEYRDVKFSDFTILVRYRSHADVLTEQMTRAQVPFIWHGDASLFSSQEALAWQALLTAINAPDFNSTNRNILRRALQTAFFDVPIEDIDNDRFNHMFCAERQRLAAWHAMAQNRMYAQLINSIFEDSGITTRLASYDKIQSLSKYNQIGNFILEQLVAKRASVAHTINVLRQQQFAPADDETGRAVERATDNPAVGISTIHAAKGLEYPVVFYLIRDTNPRETYVSTDHITDAAGNDRPRLHIMRGEKTLNTDEETTLRYVAVTRASALMFLVQKLRRNPIPHAFLNYLCDVHPRLFRVAAAYPTNKTAADILQMAANIDDADDGDDKLPGTIAMSAKKLYKHSYTSLTHNMDDGADTVMTENAQRIDKEENEDASADAPSIRQYDADCGVEIRGNMYDADKIREIKSDMRGSRYGTLIHDVFERIDFNVFDTDDRATADKHMYPIIENCRKRHGLDCAVDIIGDIVVNTMSATLPQIIGAHQYSEHFCLSALSKDARRAEIEFNLNADNDKLLNYCNGFVDLLFVRHIDGRCIYSILDWKSDLFDNAADYANYDYLKSYTADKYAIQRVLYSYCLIQWLKQFYPEQSESEIFAQYFGGIYYAYVRGCCAGTCNGIYAHTWASYDKLAAAFNNIMNTVKGGHNA